MLCGTLAFLVGVLVEFIDVLHVVQLYGCIVTYLQLYVYLYVCVASLYVSVCFVIVERST